MRKWIAVLLATIAAALGCSGQVDQTARPGAGVLTPGRTIALPGVEGRIDHMACDPAAERLYIAALGNGSLEVVDLAKGERIKSVKGLKEPQGVAFVAAQKTVAV